MKKKHLLRGIAEHDRQRAADRGAFVWMLPDERPLVGVSMHPRYSFASTRRADATIALFLHESIEDARSSELYLMSKTEHPYASLPPGQWKTPVRVYVDVPVNAAREASTLLHLPPEADPLRAYRKADA